MLFVLFISCLRGAPCNVGFTDWPSILVRSLGSWQWDHFVIFLPTRQCLANLLSEQNINSVTRASTFHVTSALSTKFRCTAKKNFRADPHVRWPSSWYRAPTLPSRGIFSGDWCSSSKDTFSVENNIRTVLQLEIASKLGVVPHQFFAIEKWFCVLAR